MCALIALNASAQTFSIKGKVIDAESGIAMEYAMVYIDAIESGAITDSNGEFEVKDIPAGNLNVKVSLLGYAERSMTLKIEKDYPKLIIRMKRYDLSLEAVSVTAKRELEGSTTNYNINSAALEHEQITNVSDIQFLLPGGKTPNESKLTSGSKPFIIQGASASEMGDPAFGTAVNVDGIRLQNNALMSDQTGVDTRNIASLNIESVNVITGIPSVEHGDLNSGLVQINTKKGVTPYTASITLNPNTKQYGINKGFDLGQKRGILNVSFERTQSFKDIASPYTAYDRNGLSLNYYQPFNGKLILSARMYGNLGGFNNQGDPDLHNNAYTKTKDNTLRGNVKLDWDIDKAWISSIHLIASANYRNLQSEVNKNVSSASTQAAIHTIEEGYHIATNYDDDPNAAIILRPTGYWEELSINDNKPRDYNLKLKADWAKVWGSYQSKLMIGAEYNNSKNTGQGFYYEDLRYAPTWREFKLSDIPSMNNIALYIEENISKELNNGGKLNLVAGLRSDNTSVGESEYGLVSSISPRFNLSYSQKYKRTSLIRNFNVYAGWGRAVKLPSFNILYPQPSYSDRISFASSSTTDNTSYIAYYTYETTPQYNSKLNWQYADKLEVGVGADFGFADVKLSGYYSKLQNTYTQQSYYQPFAYKLTQISAIEGTPIAIDDRQYTIDKESGIVTLHDASGTYASETLNYSERKIQNRNSNYINGSPVNRFSVDWIINFKQIKAIKTKFRIDGNYYRFKGINEQLIASGPNSSQQMTNGQPYSLVGYYAGGDRQANGSITKQINTNFTAITHIPKVRMIITLRVEASLLNASQNISEYRGTTRGFVTEDPSILEGTDTDIYNRNEYVAYYPEYYSTWENPDEMVAFADKFKWAKENDPDLYTDLSKLVGQSNSRYTFNERKISPYFSANINITKEIGDLASISFYARNFTHNMRTVTMSDNDTAVSLYNNALIPRFYYGLTMRLKL